MRCNPLRWLWGLLPIAALTFLVSQFEAPRIERDLAERVQDRFKAEGLAWPKVEFAGRDGIVKGRATDDTDPVRAMDVARSVWGVRIADNGAELIEKADSYAWWANRTGRSITLRGLVPNDATRQSVVGLARSQFPDAQVVDEMRLARGVPNQETWLSGIGFSLQQLAGLKSGEARLDGLGLSVSGEAASQASYRGVKTALQNNMPRGVRLTDDRVTPPVVSPYVWGARAAGSEVVLTGYVPNDRVRGEVAAAVKAAFPRNPRVTDRMEIADGAPSGFLGVVSASVKELARLEEGSANLRDTALAVDGMAADEPTAQTAKRNLRSGVPQSFRVTDQIRFRETTPPPPVAVAPPQPQTISPYTGGVELDANNRVVVTGYVPSEQAREAILRSARLRFSGRQIEDRLTIGAGAPDGWQRCFDGGMLGIARAGNGRMTMNDRRLDIVARTEDEDLASAIPGDVRGAVLGACDANVRIDYTAPQEPDLTWRAVYNGSLVTLSGDVTSQAARTALADQARRQFPQARVVDEMRVVENRSRNWPKAAEAGLASLADLNRGEAVLSRTRLMVTGDARWDPPLLDRVRERLNRDLPKGYEGREQISMNRPTAPPPPPPAVAPPPVAVPPVQRPLSAPEAVACQERLREVARSGTISFERAKANLTPESTQTLDRLAQVARNCPRVRIEIEGHTDAEGTPERNQRLSDRRANAVLTYLSRAGVDGSILSAIGYGETRPVAPNDSAENRARNRRIEFTVNE